MQLLIHPKPFFDKTINGDLNEHDYQEIKKYLDIDQDIKLKDVNIGIGADLMTISLIIAGIFFMGDKIEKNIEAWSKIAKRIKKLIKNGEVVAIDSDTADILCVDYLNENYSINDIYIKDDHRISYISLDGMLPDREAGEFISEPHNYFIKTFVADNKIFILGVSSDGKIELIKCFEDGNPYAMIEYTTDDKK